MPLKIEKTLYFCISSCSGRNRWQAGEKGPVVSHTCVCACRARTPTPPPQALSRLRHETGQEEAGCHLKYCSRWWTNPGVSANRLSSLHPSTFPVSGCHVKFPLLNLILDFTGLPRYLQDKIFVSLHHPLQCGVPVKPNRVGAGVDEKGSIKEQRTQMRCLGSFCFGLVLYVQSLRILDRDSWSFFSRFPDGCDLTKWSPVPSMFFTVVCGSWNTSPGILIVPKTRNCPSVGAPSFKFLYPVSLVPIIPLSLLREKVCCDKRTQSRLKSILDASLMELMQRPSQPKAVSRQPYGTIP